MAWRRRRERRRGVKGARMSNKINFGVDYTGQLKGGDRASDLPPM
jgi:hypothetical protein